MLKQLSILMITSSLVFSVGCTSQKTEDTAVTEEEATSGDLAEDSDDLNLDADKTTAELGSDELDLSEKLPEEQAATPDALVESTPADPAMDAPPADAMAETTPPMEEPSALTDPGPPPVEEIAVAPTPPPIEEEAPKPARATLKKIKTEPFHEAKTLINAVYIARAGDDWSSVSQKLYGGDRVKDLKKVNPYLKKRSLKVGDKVYYNSPLRPTDDQKLLTFYEDAGLPAETYMAKPGDDLKAVGKTLLGHDRSWMELWSTNLSLDSKGELTEGTEIRYWPTSDVAAPMQTMAQTETPVTELPEPPPANEPPPQETMAANELPPPPTPAEDPMAAGTVEPPPPPPPPPPPTPVVENVKPQMDATGEPSETMALGVGAILLLAAVAMFIVIRKKKARRQLEFNTGTHTQIE